MCNEKERIEEESGKGTDRLVGIVTAIGAGVFGIRGTALASTRERAVEVFWAGGGGSVGAALVMAKTGGGELCVEACTGAKVLIPKLRHLSWSM